MEVLDARKHEAAKLLAARKSQSETARALGVNRSTIGRWQLEQEFVELVQRYRSDESEIADQGLAMLVPQALKLIEEALAGKDVSAARARVALDVIKAAASITKEEAGTSTLETRLAELDARNPGQSD